MTAKRFIVDDAGTLIDMHTRDMFDIVEEVCPLLNEQHETIERLKDNCKVLDEVKCEIAEENEQLKQQLLYDGDDICGICKHEYLVPSEDYFIGKCKKGHKECSKEDIKYCEDFEKELTE